MKRFILFLLLLAFGSVALAQDGTETAGEEEGPQTTVEIFFVACEDVGVMNLTGTAQPGFDIFYQVFNGSSGTGDALTSLRRINAEGDYAFSERIPYRDGQRVAPGAVASARVIIAPVDAPENPDFETTVDDIQDGCNDAQNALQSSDDAGDPLPADQEQEAADTFGIAKPDGGFLNNAAVSPAAEPAVVIGPRTGESGERASEAGLVFAQCDAFLPEAEPGLIYDSDNVRVYWYWFAKTAETLEQNLARTNYSVSINGAPVPANTVIVSPVTPRNDVFYRFYTVPVGNLRQGYYQVSFRQTWSQAINDGFEDYGPGTANPVLDTTCNFRVTENPFDFPTNPSNLYNPSETPLVDFTERRIEGEFLDLTTETDGE